MRVMKFEGATMREAVGKVKAELGDQAVIVSTRHVRKGLLGTACEISAAIEDDDDELPAARGSRPIMTGERPGSELELERLLAPLRTELRSLRALVRAHGEPRATAELRQELAALRRLVEDLRPPPPTPAAGALRAELDPDPPSSIARALTAPSTARAIMFVGPTGAGKTTTIAKLAARAALIDEKRVAMITLDDYRVGGVDQIRTFAELIGVPLRVVEPVSNLRASLDVADELTLIDTAGRSPRDAAAIAELAGALVPTIEVHLVLPAGTTPAAIDDLVARYRPLSPTRLLFTKLDEVDEAPELSRAPLRHRLPITWVTTGQSVPEDLEEPTTARVMELASAGHRTTPHRAASHAA